jgi:acyl-CoA synthetase (NDP forming)
MRLVGPNALGVVNTAPAVRLNATLAPRLPGPGRIGFFCQSGALGIAILADAEHRGLGLSTFVSAGNRADVSGNDLLQYWETDADTDVVLLYLESFGNPRKFARLARRLARHKPVVAVKSGRRAVSPALAGTSVTVDESSVDALFEQTGVIRVESIAQLFDTALLLANQPLPAGGRVGVVGNSTAIGVLAADTAQAQGLELAFEPVDTSPQATPEEFAQAVAEALAREDVDSLVVVFVPPLAVPGSRYARALRDTVRAASEADGGAKPIVSTFLAMEGVPADLAVPGPAGTPGRGSIPSYPGPERAVLALARATRYARWRASGLGSLVRPEGIDPSAARELARDLWPATASPENGAAPVGERRLADEDVVRLLASYGITVEPFVRASDPDGCAAAADSLGYPVVVKSANEQLHHRIDLAGVRLDLTGREQVLRAYEALVEVSGTDQVYVQRMARKGTACAIGLTDDPSFGSLVSFGLSGMMTDLVADRAYRAVPLTDSDAAWLVRAPRMAPLLTGWRGLEPADLEALEDLVLRMSALAEDLPWVRSLNLEPVLASADGAAVANARVSVGDPPSRQDTGPRRLRSPGAPRERRPGTEIVR